MNFADKIENTVEKMQEQLAYEKDRHKHFADLYSTTHGELVRTQQLAGTLTEQCKELASTLAPFNRDARRYRELREHQGVYTALTGHHGFSTPEELDALVDQRLPK